MAASAESRLERAGGDRRWHAAGLSHGVPQAGYPVRVQRSFRFWVLRAAIVAAISPLALLAASGQKPPATTTALRVTVDFRVLTADGEPVLDLRPDELVLRVNGRARDVRSLRLVQVPPAGDTGASQTTSALAPPYASNVAPEGGRDLLLIIDDESITPGREQSVREAVDQLLQHVSPLDRVGLLTIPRSTLNVGLTLQHDTVAAAIAGFSGRAERGESASDVACRTRRTLDGFGEVLASSGSRAQTTVVLLSAGLTPPPTDSTARLAASSGVCQVRVEDYREIARAAVTGRANVYGVHVMDGAVNPGSATAMSLGMGVEYLAGVTGGEFVRLTGPSESVMARLARETSAYYVAEADLDASDAKNASCRVDLRVARNGVAVRVRGEFPIPRPVASRARDLVHRAPSVQTLPLRMAACPSRHPGDDRVKLVTLFEPIERDVTLTSAIVALFDGGGRQVAQWSANRADLDRRPVVAVLAAPAGSYRLRVAATDASGRAATVDDEVALRLLRAGPVQVSALALGAGRGDLFAPRLQFSTEAVAIAYLEVYGAAKTAAVTGRVELAPGATAPALVAVPATIPPSPADGVTIAYAALPIGALPPGDYLVRAAIDVDGQTVGRVTRTLRKVPQ